MIEADGMVIPDAKQDPQFRDNPLVTGAPGTGIRFYAGAPLMAEGLPVGSSCMVDTKPHEAGLTERQPFILTAIETADGAAAVAMLESDAKIDLLITEQLGNETPGKVANSPQGL